MIDIEKSIREDKGIPTLPPIAVKIINLINDENTTASQLAEIIIKDGALTTKLLKLVNSSLYSFKKDITTIRTAISLLGLRSVSSIVLSVSIIDSFRNNSSIFDLTDFWEKSLFTAVTAQLLARHCNLYFTEECFIVGLLANISYLFLNQNHSNEFKIISQNDNNIKKISLELELFGMTHAEISALILKHSNLPALLWKPIKYHHSSNTNFSDENKEINQIISVLQSATLITEMFYDKKISDINVKNKISKTIKIDDTVFDNLLFHVPSIVKETSDSFGLKSLKFPSYIEILKQANQELIKINLSYGEIVKDLKKEQDRSKKLSDKLEETNRKLLGIALKDPLTGAYNRRFLNERLDEEISKVKRYKTQLLIITCDIDHFKAVNDTYGHNNGDIVLKRIVLLMKMITRKEDFVARTGGEEFAILCHSTNKEDGIIIAEKIRSLIEMTPFKLAEGQNLNITMSFGVAVYNTDFVKVDDFIKLADDRLYKAKETGRNKVVSE